MNQRPPCPIALPDPPCKKHVRPGPGGACLEVADFVLWSLKISLRPCFQVPPPPDPGAGCADKAPSPTSAITPCRRNLHFREGKLPKALPTDVPATRCS